MALARLSVVGLLVLIVLIGLVFTAILFATKHRSARGPLIGLVVFIPVLVLFVMFFSLKAQRVEYTEQVGTVIEPADSADWIQVPQQVTHHQPTWPEAPGLADAYPSQATAAKSIAKWATRQLNTIPNASNHPLTLSISGDADTDWLKNVATYANHLSPSVRARHVAAGQATPPSGASLVINNTPLETDGITTTLSVNLSHNENAWQAMVTHSDQPWVEHPQREENDKGWTVAYSNELASKATEAQQQALNNAIAELTQAAYAAHPHIDRSLFREVIGHNLQHNLINDLYFTQRFNREFGTVYRAAVVLDTNHASVPQIIAQAQERQAQITRAASTHRAHQRSQWAGIVALVACVALIYAVLNVVTKGYYLWSLRTMAIILTAGGVLLLVLLT